MIKNIYKKEFSIIELFSNSWIIFKKNILLIFILSIILYLPENLILYIINLDKENSIKYKLFYIGTLLINTLIIMAISYFIKNKIDKKNITIYESLKKSFSKLIPLVKTTSLYFIYIILLSLLLIIPGIIYFIYWIFIIFTIILNNKSGSEALSYSHKIVENRWWTVAIYISILFITEFLLESIIIHLFSIFTNNLIIESIKYLILDIIMFFFIIIKIIFYINFEATKKEISE